MLIAFNVPKEFPIDYGPLDSGFTIRTLGLGHLSVSKNLKTELLNLGSN